MIENTLFILNILAALGCGVMAGIFFVFSNFGMKSLGQLRPPEGITAMQVMNVVILNPLFFLFFMGTAVVSIALTALLIWQRPQPGAGLLIAGSLLYLVGVMAVTIAFNVPLNDALAAVEPDSEEGQALWARYLRTWTNWNHVRTVTSILGTLAFVLGLA